MNWKADDSPLSIYLLISWKKTQIHHLLRVSRLKSAGYGKFLITSKVLDVRRRGATTEVYGAIHRKPVESLKVEREERSKATQPFGFTQGHEPVEWQMMP